MVVTRASAGGDPSGEGSGAACRPRGGELASGEEVASGDEVASGEVVASAAAEDTAAQYGGGESSGGGGGAEGDARGPPARGDVPPSRCE